MPRREGGEVPGREPPISKVPEREPLITWFLKENPL